MAKPLNPFIVEGYVGAEYFCDRIEETQKLMTALENGRNITLISPRRMGKSGLIHHAFSLMKGKDKSIKCFYIDLLHTQSLSDFINLFANAVLGELDNSFAKLYKKTMELFGACRPVFSTDPVSGTPTFTLTLESSQEQHTLKEIFEYLNKSEKRIYIAFDEFQQVSEYPQKGTEALLRSYIQFTPNINFIFAGSKMHMMHGIFQAPSRPFYQSTQTLPLFPIEKDIYREFCQKFFAEDNKNLLPETFDYIYDQVKGHTWYVQCWMSKIYDAAPKNIDIKVAQKSLEGIMRDEDLNFYTYNQLLTPAQRKVIKGLAKLGTLEAPFSTELINKVEMGAPSTVRSCLKTLVEKEIVLEERGVYTVYNRFFMLWLAAMK